ncbi:MAG TPA: LacI family transcriptional regulator [bacterium]|nr:LacI family transcriptional regulator [bacterium]
MKRTTIKDIAQKLNINHAIVSRVLNRGTGFSEDTRQLVLRAAEELEYVPNIAARMLAHNKTWAIANVMSTYSGIFPMESMRGAEDAHIGTGYSFLPVSNSRYKTKGGAEEDRKIFEDILTGRKADAVIATTVYIPDSVIAEYAAAGLPLISLDPVYREGEKPAGILLIEFDNFRAGYMAGQRFISKGRKKTGIIAVNPEWVTSQRERLKGLKKAMEDAGLCLPDSSVHVFSTITDENEREMIDSTLDKKYDSIFCAAGEWTVAGLISKARKRGIRVPEDLSIIGMDDSGRFAETMGLTAIRQPVYEMGKTAFEKAYGLAQGISNPKDEIVYKPEIIIRETA